MSHPSSSIFKGALVFLRPRPDSPEAPEGPGTSSKMCAFQIVYSATMFTLTFNSVIFHHIHIHIYPQSSTLTFSKSYPTYLLSLSNNQPLHVQPNSLSLSPTIFIASLHLLTFHSSMFINFLCTVYMSICRHI